MSSPTSSSTVRLGPLRLAPAVAGTIYCLVSMLGYSTTNACMNQLSLNRCDATWAVCNKELITVVAVGPWLLWKAWRQRSGFPTRRPLAILIAVGLATELIGNIGVQWGYEVVGLAVMVPAYTGFLLIATVILGGILLGERVSAHNLAVVGLLILALTLLGVGSAQAAPVSSAKSPASPWMIVAALVVAGAVGTVFSLLGIAIRHCVTGKTSYAAVMVIITGMGVLSLAPLSFFSAGAAKLMATTWQQYALMFAAGICNLVAFFALIRGLQLTTVLHVNMINAGQVAMAALLGVLVFRETWNPWLVLGIGLMTGGIASFRSPKR